MADGLARQIAGLAGDIRNLGKRIPSYQRGVVANVSPPTVIMDRDVTATPRPVADVLVPGLTVGQRVEVRVIGSRRVITSIHPADNESYVPFAMAAGTIVASFSNEIFTSPVITFPAGRFTTAPILNLTFGSTSGGTQQVVTRVSTSIDKDSATISVRFHAAQTGNYTVYWQAVQMTPTSAEG